MKLKRIKPIDENAVKAVLNANNVVFFEEGIRSGGIAESFASKLLENNAVGNYRIVAVNDEFVEHASVPRLFVKYSLDEDGIYRICSEI